MLKYFNNFFGYEGAGIVQVLVLFASIMFFVLLIYSVMRKPKNYYKKSSRLPFEEGTGEEKYKN